MHADYLLVDYCAAWKHVKQVGEGLPQLDRIPALALLVKPIDFID
jgi:hypothetical protein